MSFFFALLAVLTLPRHSFCPPLAVLVIFSTLYVCRKGIGELPLSDTIAFLILFIFFLRYQKLYTFQSAVLAGICCAGAAIAVLSTPFPDYDTFIFSWTGVHPTDEICTVAPIPWMFAVAVCWLSIMYCAAVTGSSQSFCLIASFYLLLFPIETARGFEEASLCELLLYLMFSLCLAAYTASRTSINIAYSMVHDYSCVLGFFTLVPYFSHWGQTRFLGTHSEETIRHTISTVRI